jgi:hypothetical protein
MPHFRLLAVYFCAFFLFAACSKKSVPEPNSAQPAVQSEQEIAQKNSTERTSPPPGDTQYEEIEWPDLMPKEDLEALMNPPEYLDDIADGSEEDALPDQFSMQTEDPDDPYQKALVSTKIIPEFNKRKIRLPGFIVPLDFDDHYIITQFLLVPFFGACIHLPPPPPNQIIFATYEPGLTLDDLSDAFFVEGTIFTELKKGEIATSAYSMTIDRVLPYEED